jgi:hypothetical protein
MAHNRQNVNGFVSVGERSLTVAPRKAQTCVLPRLAAQALTSGESCAHTLAYFGSSTRFFIS